MKPETGDLIFYDGLCGLCNRTVRFILKRDPQGLFSFAPLQGATAKTRLQSLQPLPDSLVILSSQGRVMLKSEGVFYILKRLGFFWHALGALGAWMPKGLMDWGYDFVARHRAKVFGRFDSCPLPKPEWRQRFLDL